MTGEEEEKKALQVERSKTQNKKCLICRLITHAYCAQLQHLTNGSKLGAQIAEKQNLFAKKAVNMYRRYPHDIIGKVSPGNLLDYMLNQPDWT